MLRDTCNYRHGNPYSMQQSCFSLLLHHSVKEACRWPYVQKFLTMFRSYYEKACLSFQNSKNFFGNLKETWLRSRNASYSFYFKAPTVIVYEITGIITRETQLTTDSDSGTEEGYQLPESGPPGQSDWFSEEIWRQKKSRAEPNGKAHLWAGLWVVNQHLFWPSTKRGWCCSGLKRATRMNSRSVTHLAGPHVTPGFTQIPTTYTFYIF